MSVRNRNRRFVARLGCPKPSERGTSGKSAPRRILSWHAFGIHDGRGNAYSLEQARELIALGFAETNCPRLLAALEIGG